MINQSALDAALSTKENVDLLLSYSRVSDFDRNGPSALITRVKEESQALKKGSLVDDLLFSKETFDDKYYVSVFEEPTASLGVLAKIILKNFNTIPSKEVIENLISINDLWTSIKDPSKKKAKWDLPSFYGYLTSQFASSEKTLVTRDEISLAEHTVETLRTHKFSKDLFSEEFQHVYQHPFTIEIRQFTFRGFIDIITIDHDKKIVYLKDLKTGGGPSAEFTSSFIKWRYYLQEAVYSLAFEQICKDLGLEGYTQAPFEFVYIGFKEQIPVRYIVTPTWHDAALNGFKTSGGYIYKGLYELIDEIYFHWKNQIYDLPMSVYVNNGAIDLDDSFINTSK